MTVWKGDMADVAEICGDDVAQELCDKLPGIKLYVPQKINRKTPLNHIDIQIANRLMAQFGGDALNIPSNRKTFHETFDAVEALVEKGLTTQEIALRLGITQSYVFKVRRNAGAPKIASKVDPRQLPLFD